ncbi:MAG: protein kinase [Gemmataceae bacterium]|nr:protein kinase [Gemmataceae bacterium]
MGTQTARTVPGDIPAISETLRDLWSKGERPDVRAVLAAHAGASPEDMLDAIVFDQRARWQSGERIPAEAYLQWFPALLADDELTLDLVYHEFLLREQQGDEPKVDEYVLRFPKQAESLQLQVELHRAIDKDAWSANDDHADDTAPLADRPHRSTPEGLLPDESPLPEIPGYDILDEIGRGGMGVIYKARRRLDDCLVALKMISSGEFASHDELARFRTEAQAIVQLQHPHIVQVYEVGAHRGLPWFALEYMDRGSLAGRIAGNPLPPREAAQLVEVLARAMQAAHERGIIHRDLKPANVLLATPTAMPANGNGPVTIETTGLLGVPKISDFGLAKRLDGDGGQTTSGAILGTPNYMAPEQAAGKTKHVGPAADIYSLGAILYEALTGQPPHKGATLLETLELVRIHEPTAPDALRPGLPGQLVAICLKALAKEPHRRYPTAAAMADDLRLFLGHGRVKARREVMIERGWRWCRRNPLLAGLSGGVAILLLVALAVLGIAALVRDERDKAIEAQKRAEDADQKTRAALSRLNSAQAEIEMRSHLAKAGFYRRSGQVGQRFKTLAELKAAMALRPSAELRDEMRNEALAALVLPDVEVAREWQVSPEAASGALVFTRDYKKFARLFRSGEVHVGRITDAGGEEVLLRLPAFSEPPYIGPYWSPDGRYLLIARRKKAGVKDAVRLWRVDGPEPVICLAPEDEDTSIYEDALGFSSDSQRVALGQPDGTVRIFDVATGKRLKTLKLAGPPWHLRYHPLDNRLAAAVGKQALILDPEGATPPLLLAQQSPIWSLDWHPDGKRLAVAGHDMKIHIWDTEAAKEIMALSGHREAGIVLQFNPDGDRMISTDYSGQMRLWDMASGRMMLTTTGFNVAWLNLAWGVDQGLVGFDVQGRKGRLLRLAHGRELRLLRRPGAEENEWNQSPEGQVDARVLAANAYSPSSGRRWICLFDLERGEALQSFGGLGFPAVCSRHEDGWLTTVQGVLLWPCRPDANQPSKLRFGPPQRLARGEAVAANRDATVLAVPRFKHAWVINRHRPEQSFQVDELYDVRRCAVSPDGHWVVLCSHWTDQKTPSARIWDARTGQHVHDLPMYGLAQAWFSPDGRWLVTSSGDVGGRVWEVGSWREVWSFPASHPAFTPDSAIMALGGQSGVVRLVATATGKELGRLTGLPGDVYVPAAFTGDGARLIANTRDNKFICVWDLRQLRAGLKELDLDWAWPELLPAPELPPLQSAEIDYGYLRDYGRLMDGPQRLAHGNRLLVHNPLNPDAYWFRGMGNHLLKNRERAVIDLSLFLTLTPAKDPRRAEAYLRRAMLRAALKQPEAALDDALQLLRAGPQHIPETEWAAKECNNLAWPYVFAGRKKELVAKAVAVARAAVDLEPWDADHRNTLGMVLYRDGQYREAIDMMEKNLPRDHLYAGYDFYFLAMSCQRIGDPAKSKEYFDRAVGWEKQRTDLNDRIRSALKSFQTEARTTLQLP